MNVSCRDLRYDDGTHLTIETVPDLTMYIVSVGFSALWRMWTPAFSLAAVLISLLYPSLVLVPGEFLLGCDWRVKESTTMATPTIRFQGRADVDLRRFLRCSTGETGVTSMQIVIVPELR